MYITESDISDMTVEEKIRLVVERMGKLNYMYCDLTEGNFRLDYEHMPSFVNVLPLTGTIHVTPTQIRNYPRCAFWFVDRINLDATGDDIKNVTERCMNYAYEFILWLNASKLFEPIENTEVSFTVITSDMDANVSGVMLEVTLREKEGLRLCGKNPNEYFDEEGRCETGCSGGAGQSSEEDN